MKQRTGGNVSAPPLPGRDGRITDPDLLLPKDLRKLAKDAMVNPGCLSRMGVYALAKHLLLALDMNLKMERVIHELVKESENWSGNPKKTLDQIS